MWFINADQCDQMSVKCGGKNIKLQGTQKIKQFGERSKQLMTILKPKR